MALSEAEELELLELELSLEGDLPELPTQQITEKMTDQQLANLESGGFLNTQKLSPIQEEEKNFQERVQPIQDIAQEAREKSAEERMRRRTMQELDPDTGRPSEGQGATFGETLENYLLTTQVTENPNATGVDKILGTSTFPIRLLGAVAQQGDLADEDTMLLKSFQDDLNEWAESREVQNATADQMIANLQGALDKYEDLPEENKVEIQSQIDELEASKNSGALTTGVDVLGKFFLEIGSDPSVLLGIGKNLFKGGKALFRTKDAKKLVQQNEAAKLGVKRGAGIPNDEFIQIVSDLPGNTVKEKLRYLRTVKTAPGSTQTGGKFKSKFIQDQIESVDEVALQRQLDDLTSAKTSSISDIKQQSAIAEGEIEKTASEQALKIKKRFNEREQKLYDLASKKDQEFIDRAIPNSAEEFISKVRKGQKKQHIEMLDKEIKRIDSNIKDINSLGNDVKANIKSKLRDRRDAIILEKESALENIAAETTSQIRKTKGIRDTSIEGVENTLQKDIASIKPEVDVEDVAKKLTGEGEFVGKGSNKGFEEAKKLGRNVSIPEAQRKEALHDMIAASRGDSFGSRDYSELVNAMWGKVDQKAPLDEYKKVLKSQDIDPNLAETFRRIKLGNVQDLTASKKGITKAFEKSYGDIDDAVIDAAKNYTQKIDEIIEGNVSKEGMELLLSNRALGGEEKKAKDFLESAMKIGNKNPKFIEGADLENAASNLDDFFDGLADKYVKTGKMPSGELDRLKKFFNIDAKKEVLNRSDKIRLLKEAEEAKKLIGKQTSESLSSIREARSLSKAEASSVAKDKIREEIKKSSKSISQVESGLQRRIDLLSKQKGPNQAKIAKLQKELDEIQQYDAAKKASTSSNISFEKKQFAGRMRKIRSGLKSKRDEALSSISNSKSEAIKNNKILNSKNIEEIQSNYDIKSKQINDALNQHEKKLTVWGDFNNIVRHYATDGSFNSKDELVLNFRKKYGDKLADLIPDAGVMALLDIDQAGKVLNNDNIIEAFKGVSFVGANTTARTAKTGADIVNKIYRKVSPYTSRLDKAFDKLRSLDVKTAKRINKLKKKGKLSEEGRKEAFEIMMKDNPLIGADILSQEFKFFEPLEFAEKAFILRAAASTTDEFTNRQKLAAKRLKAKLERQGKLK